MRILVIEDNPKLAEALRRGLEEQSYSVEVCSSGHQGEDRAAAERWDLILLDLMLPDCDGLDVCRGLRRKGADVPILVLTSLSETEQKVAGLDAGADDYLTKPFEFPELLARVRALFRRGKAGAASTLQYEDLELDLLKRVARRDGRQIKLSTKEFALLEFLMRHPDEVLGRSTIAQKVWGLPYEPSSNVIDVYVSSLRRKMDRGFEVTLLHTVVGAGYRFGAPDPVS